jgi:hypothetical protein
LQDERRSWGHRDEPVSIPRTAPLAETGGAGAHALLPRARKIWTEAAAAKEFPRVAGELRQVSLLNPFDCDVGSDLMRLPLRSFLFGACVAASPAVGACPEGRSGYADYQANLPFTTMADPRTGASLCYPPTVFRMVEAGNGGLRFLSDDGLAGFTLARTDTGGQSARALAEAAAERLRSAQASITYRRTAGDWFVLSGYRGTRIYYQKSVMSAGGALDTLVIDFPQEQKPFYYDIVERMSWSFTPRRLGAPRGQADDQAEARRAD